VPVLPRPRGHVTMLQMASLAFRLYTKLNFSRESIPRPHLRSLRHSPYSLVGGRGGYSRVSTSVANGVFTIYGIRNKKHLKKVGPIRHCEPPHAHSPNVASGTVARRLCIDVHDNDDNDNA